MKLRTISLALGALALAAGAFAAPLTTGNIVLNQLSGTTSAAAGINFLEFSPTDFGTPVQTISIASTGTDAITQSGSATSEGGIAGIAGGNGLYFVGYNSDAGTASVVGAGSARRVGQLNYTTGTVSYTTLDSGAYGANNIRFASGYPSNGTAGSSFITAGNAAGGNGGARTGTFGSGATTIGSGALANTRVSYAFGGDLYTSAASGAFLGVTRLNATGDPTLVLGDGTGSSAYDFQFFGGGAVAYVIDDRAAGTTPNTGGGLQKFVRNTDGSYTKVYTIGLGTVGGRQFAATAPDATGNVTFYAVGSNNQLYSFSDNTSATSLTTAAVATSIYTAPTGTSLRGVEVVPEPASMAAIGLGLVGLVSRRRKKSAK